MIPKRFSGLSILLILALLISSFAVVMPAAPVHAAPPTVTITAPLATPTTALGYVKQGGILTVTYDLVSTGSPQTYFEVVNSSGVAVGISGTYMADTAGVGRTRQIQMNTLVAPGTYSIKWYATNGEVSSATSSNSVIVDNTPPTISILAPAGGDYWADGVLQTISWNATDNLATPPIWVACNITTNGGATYPQLQALTSQTQGVGTLSYTPLVGDSNVCKIAVLAQDKAGNTSAWVYNGSNFTIISTHPTSTGLTAPIGGESWSAGSVHPITFGANSYNSAPIAYRLRYSTTGVGGSYTDIITSTWSTFQAPTGNPISYSWTVPSNVSSTDCWIKLQLKDKAENLSVEYFSAAAFSIVDTTPPTVSITAPINTTRWYALGTENITFTASDNLGANLTYTVEWRASTSDGWHNIYGPTAAAQGPRIIPWTTLPNPTATTATYQVRVTASDGTSTDTSVISNAFTIVRCDTPIVVTVTAPVASSSWAQASLQTITWTATSSCDSSALVTYDLYYAADGSTWGTPFATLSNQTLTGTKSYSWAVSANTAVCTNKIKVVATNPKNTQQAPGEGISAAFCTTVVDFPIETATVTLASGWNLISLPLIPVKTSGDLYPSPETILSTCIADIDTASGVWYYDPTLTTTNKWRTYVPGAPANLTTMEDGKAYWIKTLRATHFDFQGRRGNPPPSGMPSYSVKVGWNMIGYKSMTTESGHGIHSVAQYLGNTAYSRVIGFTNPSTWTNLAATDNMTPTAGYWVYFDELGSFGPFAD